MPTDDTSNTESPDLHEFFAKDPLEADRAFFGRESYSDRRGFLRGAGLATMAAMVGAAIPFHRNMPAGLIPAAFADENLLVGKDGLTLLNDRPLNAETPPHLLDDAITPTSRHFIRNNGLPPVDVDPAAWTLSRRRPRRQSLHVLDRRPAIELRSRHDGPPHRVRGQRAGLLRSRRPRATSGPTARSPARSGRGCDSRTC